RAGFAQLGDLANRPRGGGDLVARRYQPGNQVPSQRSGRARDEDSHELSFRIVLSLEDKAAPAVVTRAERSEHVKVRMTVAPPGQHHLADHARAGDGSPVPAVARVAPVVAKHVELAGRHAVRMLAARIR